MQISVVIPTLGTRNEYLQESLESIFSQTMQPIEIIIVNNGVGAVNLADFNLTGSIPIVIVQTVSNAGVSQARNFGATIAKGNVIAFLDDDDLWDRDFLRLCLNDLVSSGAQCVLGRIDKLIDGKISQLFDATGFLDSYSFIVMNPGATGSNVVIYRDTFMSIGGYDCSLPPTEDGALILSLIDTGQKVSVCPEAQAIMRIHSGVRLTNPGSASIGFKAFYIKYGKRVGIKDRFFLIWKFRREDYRNSSSMKTLFYYAFYSALIVLIRRRPRNYWTPLQPRGFDQD